MTKKRKWHLVLLKPNGLSRLFLPILFLTPEDGLVGAFLHRCTFSLMNELLPIPECSIVWTCQDGRFPVVHNHPRSPRWRESLVAVGCRRQVFLGRVTEVFELATGDYLFDPKASDEYPRDEDWEPAVGGEGLKLAGLEVSPSISQTNAAEQGHKTRHFDTFLMISDHFSSQACYFAPKSSKEKHPATGHVIALWGPLGPLHWAPRTYAQGFGCAWQARALLFWGFVKQQNKTWGTCVLPKLPRLSKAWQRPTLSLKSLGKSFTKHGFSTFFLLFSGANHKTIIYNPTGQQVFGLPGSLFSFEALLDLFQPPRGAPTHQELALLAAGRSLVSWIGLEKWCVSLGGWVVWRLITVLVHYLLQIYGCWRCFWVGVAGIGLANHLWNILKPGLKTPGEDHGVNLRRCADEIMFVSFRGCRNTICTP